jgi:hypothetical protein
MGEAEELIRDVWERWNRGERDPSSSDFDSEIEIHSALAGGAMFRGEQGLREWVEEAG